MAERQDDVEGEVPDEAPNGQPFADKVWRTLGAIDVTGLVSEKTVKVQAKEGRQAYQFTLSYISWVSAWQHLIECFPESYFEFDEPKYFQDGTGEQWVTVSVVDGEKVLRRRWWLPYMDQTNRAVKNPSATQINTTRMRVLTKCIAMCGLGIEVYGGEDIEDRQQDETPTSNAPRKLALEGTNVDEVAVEGFVEAINIALPEMLADVSDTGNVNKIHYDLLEDWQPITKVAMKIMQNADLAIAVTDRLVSWRRSITREAVKRYREESKQADLEAAGEEG